MITDGRQVVEFVKSRFRPLVLTLYGRSIGGHVARALHDLADVLVLDRTFTSIGLIPRFKIGRWAQKICDFMLDNYEYNVQSLANSGCKKIIIYDPKQDEVVGYLSSLTFGLTAELAKLLYNKRGKKTKDRIASEGFTIFKRLESARLTEEYFNSLLPVVEYYKFVLNERDTRLFFLASRRLIRACFFRAELDKDPAHKNRLKMMEFAAPPLLDDLEIDLLDEDTLSSIHSDQRILAENKNINSELFEYSRLLEVQNDKERAMNILDNVDSSKADIQCALVR